MFIGLSSEASGGAISVDSARSLGLLVTLIKGCSSSSRAGGLYDSSCSSVSISRSCTSFCTCSKSGCCVIHSSVTSEGGLTQSSSSFILSKSDIHQVIQFASLNLPGVNDCNASSNSVAASYVFDIATSSIGIRAKRDNFFNNSVGGRLFWYGGGAHEVNEANFVENSAEDGEFFYLNEISVLVLKCVFIKNSAQSFSNLPYSISVIECASFENGFEISGYEVNQRPKTHIVILNNPCERVSLPFSPRLWFGGGNRILWRKMAFLSIWLDAK